MEKVLITGIAGFVGSHLAERLGNRAELWGALLDDKVRNISKIKGLNLVRCDLLDAPSVKDLIEKVRPDKVYHLAAQSVPSLSFSNPAETLKVNVFSALNLFEATVAMSPGTVILNIGSGDEYGDVDEKDLPLKETALLKPINPYAVSKVAQDLLAFQYWKSKGLKVVRCRPFNHFGPRQSEAFVTAAFAKQIAEIEAGIKKEKVLDTGNLEASKDFLDVRDVVAAYELLIDRGDHGAVYNVCSGSVVKIREMVETLVSFSKERIEVREEASKRRPTDTVAICGDASKLKSLGWRQEYGLQEGLKAVLEFWRKEVRGATGC